MARNPGERAADSFTARIDPVFEKLARSIRARINAGVPVNQAVDEAVKKAGIENILTDNLLKKVQGLLKQMDAPIDASPAFRASWLNRTWPGDNMTLSVRVNKLSRMDDIKASITADMRAGESWKQIAWNMSEQNLQKADLAAHSKQLVDAARRMTDDPETIAAYRDAVRNSMKQIDRLAQNGAPTRMLKNAYKEIINVSEKTAGNELDNAIDRLAREKMRYNADRIARTEMAKAYSQGEYSEAVNDEDVIGMGYDLSDRHPKTDICDFHTSVDLFGLGEGRYPLSNLPPYPFHPHCLCTMYKISSGDVGSMNPKAAERYIKSLPVDERRALLGVDGAKDFQRNPESWSANLTGYDGHKSIQELMAILTR